MDHAPGVVWAAVDLESERPGLHLRALNGLPLFLHLQTGDSRLCQMPCGVGEVAQWGGCSSRGPSFSSQHPQGSSQPSVTWAIGNPTPSSGLCGHQAQNHIGVK